MCIYIYIYNKKKKTCKKKKKKTTKLQKGLNKTKV